MEREPYKVEVSKLLIDATEWEIQEYLNKMFLEGWRLHSVTPMQVNGTVRNIVFIFEKGATII
ncbi:DUF4177 domain-containing protein [Paenibacillus sp. M1]|uniref:DUF4177 domain-containing protein n=2 Tax=Paenibacillus TaxID=44249 RepID=A0A3P3TYK8_9BACL|nr:DUF4177 domain-containing protein [Paenibacillus oralis]RRJ62920.1 DUF4177 domain-containing protein [Paenibacillus oralis]